jgi:hypothetical protein
MARATLDVEVDCPEPRCYHTEKGIVSIAIHGINSGAGISLMMDSEVLNGPELTAAFTAHYLETHRSRERRT